MLTYITIGTNDLQRAAAFYDAIFNVLGYSRVPAWTEDWAMWGDENNPDEGFSFCICPPFDRQPATAGNGTMFAFRADNAELVRRFHAVGLLAGGKSEGMPGTRTAYGPDFYVAYLRDPDGHKLACVCQHYSPEADEYSKEQ
ncbi:VOC family protein [Enterobacter asburiae]|uniref:VOC family protein n=1 Tax=Enterobacter asburiae TaxID=61645 RepID=A0A8I1G1H6_ENTAS|nr:VOC family protein [Enterobacter asburiae]EMB6149574.1 VOC family protein [Enterobacter asburiae]MBJ6598833.1 VOC family protein [Enterobacter asburiae]MBK4466098.1 VOC family protein [Enterobacter asburiae]MBK4576112.1 VOC family protein [Enterobacter asburiae]BEK74207.1 VOC family protein [Enterobacter asburiae]